MIRTSDWEVRMLGLRVPGRNRRTSRAKSLAVAAVLLGSLLVVGMRASQAVVAGGATPGTPIHLSLWPAGKGQIKVMQNGVPVIPTQQDGSPIPGGLCDFVFVLQQTTPCDVVVVAGTPVTLTALIEPDVVIPGGLTDKVPDLIAAQPAFKRWTVSGCEGTGPCTFTPDGDSDWVGAIFTPLQLQVGINGAGTVGVQGPGGGLDPQFICGQPGDPVDFLDATTRVCHGRYAADSSVVLVASPDNLNAPFVWGEGCQTAGNPPTCTVEMTNLRTFGVVGFGDPGLFPPPGFPFKISPQVRVALDGSGHGRVTGSGYDCGSLCTNGFSYQDRVTLQATPDPGSQFIHWQGVCSTDPICSFSAGSATLVKAVFDVPPATQPSTTSTTSTTSTPSTTSTTSTTTVTTTAGPLAARLGTVSMKRRAGRRVLQLTLVTDRAARATLRFSRHRRTIRVKQLSLHPGRTLVQLAIPRTLKPGRYQLLVRVIAGHEVRTFPTSVTIGR
jgi:hypothetical protein